MSKEFNRALKAMDRIDQVAQKNNRIKVENNNKVFLYVGTFFIVAASLSTGILIIMYFLIKLDGSF